VDECGQLNTAVIEGQGSIPSTWDPTFNLSNATVTEPAHKGGQTHLLKNNRQSDSSLTRR